MHVTSATSLCVTFETDGPKLLYRKSSHTTHKTGSSNGGRIKLVNTAGVITKSNFYGDLVTHDITACSLRGHEVSPYLHADLKGNPGKPHSCDTVRVVLCHIEVKSDVTRNESPCDTDKDIADPADNHDNITKELLSPLAVPLLASANVNIGTVAGTVLNTRLPNSCETREIIVVSTCDFDYDTKLISLVFDPIGGR